MNHYGKVCETLKKNDKLTKGNSQEYRSKLLTFKHLDVFYGRR
jgi:hypothetical protein